MASKKIKPSYSPKPASRKEQLVQTAGTSPSPSDSPEPLTPDPKSVVRKPAKRG
jgi:hypothetical protein